MKTRNIFICQACGHQQTKWLGRCPSCNEWNSLVEEEITLSTNKKKSSSSTSTPVLLSQVRSAQTTRRCTGLIELDRVLGGGLVEGALVLVGGDPGIGKSTLLLQAMGNLGHEAHQIDYNEIARDAAETFSGRLIYMSAPAILGTGSGSAEEFITTNPMLAESLDQARDADIFVVGLGSMESDVVYTRVGLIKEEEFNDLRGQVVGDICGRFFDINGVEKPSPFNDRLVGVNLADIHNGAFSIGVAGGPDKAAPLLGAIRGNHINALVSDEQTVHSILALDDAYPS